MPINYEDLKKAFPRAEPVEGEKPSKYITLTKEPDQTYTGLFRRFGAPIKKTYEGKTKDYTPAFFEETWDGKPFERQMDCSWSLFLEFEMAGVDENTWITVNMKKDENDYWKFSVEPAEPKAKAAPRPPAEDGEIDVSDIPF